VKESRSVQGVPVRKTPIAEISRVSPPSQLRTFFEFDRAEAADRLRAMTTAAQDNALELEMIAAEKVFEEATCEEFSRVANEFTTLAGKLTLLNGRVMKAKGYPSDLNPGTHDGVPYAGSRRGRPD
jgi:hypothetical protein